MIILCPRRQQIDDIKSLVHVEQIIPNLFITAKVLIFMYFVEGKSDFVCLHDGDAVG